MRRGVACFLIICSFIQATRGIVIPCCDRYMHVVLENLQILRGVHDCQLPIEIWYAGNELDDECIEALKAFSPISFKDIAAIRKENPKKFRGWQIKGYAIGYTNFDEVILLDADLMLFQNPEILFDHPGYIQTGAFLFRDQTWSIQGGIDSSDFAKPFTDSYYFARKRFLTKVIEKPSSYLPQEWSHYWDPEIKPTKTIKISLDHVESGCVLIDRKRHARGVESIVDLNRDYKETYKLFWGDKETYWVAFEMEKEPYFVNPEYPKTYFTHAFDSEDRIDIVQFINDTPFYQQKSTKKPTEASQFIDADFQTCPFSITKYEGHFRYLTEEEIDALYQAYFLSKTYMEEI